MADAGPRLATIAQAVAIALLLVVLASVSASAQAPSTTTPATTPATTLDPVTASAAPDQAIDTGDPRSDGQGPGIVGEPLLVLLGIVVIGAVTVVTTVLVARATGRA